jgi:D-alanyl-D-alanine carboxypeptidase (penicillin-binding protein 5/6)
MRAPGKTRPTPAVVVVWLVAASIPLAGPRAFAQSVPPPTPVPPAGSPSPFPSTLDTPEPSRRPPDLAAASSILADLDSGETLFEARSTRRRPIASLTKIMTALLVLEATEPRDVVTASPAAAAQSGAELGLEPGEQVPVRDLLYALMLQSANDAAVALAEHVSGSVDAFVDGMNRRAGELGLRDTSFASANGLDDSGYSTAADLAGLTAEAYREPGFAKVASTRFREIPAPTGEPRLIQNRNALLWLYPGAIGVKTGYTSAAGFCLVAVAERDGLRLAAVILGAPAEAFSDAAEALNFGFAAFERLTVVEEGQSFDPIEVQDREVPVAAEGSLEVLLRRGQEVVLTVRPDPGLSLPVGSGERVGVVRASSEGVSLGEVPLVAAETVREGPDRGERPWWERAWGAVVDWVDRVWQRLVG